MGGQQSVPGSPQKRIAVGDGEYTMRAWVMEQSGKISDMRQLRLDIPQPVGGEVGIKIFAAGINPVDYKRAQYTTGVEFPAVLGVDGAGVVESIGVTRTSRY
eukprot:gene9923-3113_t